MDTTGCPRCAAERRARWVRVVMNLVLAAAILLGAATCWATLPLAAAMEPPWTYAMTDLLRAQARAWGLAGLAFTVAWVGIGLRAVVDRLTRRASTPLPPPAAYPLATYRDGPPAECPRHPFAR